MSLKINLFLCIILAVACDSQQPSNKNTNKINPAVSEEIIEEDGENEFHAIHEKDSTAVSIENFPKTWIKLSSSEEYQEFYIQHYCEAELAQIMITAEKGDHWKLSALYGQDSESWMIDEFDAHQTQMEHYQVTIGTILLSGEYNQNTKTEVTFCWNMDENHCNFQGLSSFNDAFFVNEEARSNYKEEREDCEGLWED